MLCCMISRCSMPEPVVTPESHRHSEAPLHRRQNFRASATIRTRIVALSSRKPQTTFPPGNHKTTPPRSTMAPKRSQARESTPSAAAKAQSATASGTSTPSRPAPAAVAASSKSSVKFSANQSPQEVALGIWKNYLDTTPQRTKLIDVFIAFLVVVGVLQFVYCVLVGNYVCLLHSHFSLRVNADFGTIAIQCLPVWLFGNCWPICLDKYVAMCPCCLGEKGMKANML
jgi:hypothetical protein